MSWAPPTWLWVLATTTLITLDVFIPSGGLLSGAGIALGIERLLASLGVAASVRLPLAAVGMLLAMSVVIHYGERLSELLFPARIKTNVARVIGATGRVRRITDDGFVVEIDGDLWSAQADDGTVLSEGDRVEVLALCDQMLTVRSTDDDQPS